MKTVHRMVGSVVLVIFLILASMLLAPYISNPEQVRSTVAQFGYAGWAIYLVLLTVSGPLPIPSSAVVLGGGFLYGNVLGGILSLIGLVLGGIISFYMIRYGGRSLLEKLVDHHHRIHFYHLLNERGHVFVLFAFAIPVFPADIICLLLGLTHMKFRTLLWLLITGSIPRAILVTALGTELSIGFTWKVVLLLAICGIGVLITIFREKIKRFIFYELHEVEHLIAKAERHDRKEI